MTGTRTGKTINLRIVDSVPRTYVRGFGALPFGETRHIHPRTHMQDVLSFDLEALDRWYGVNDLDPWKIETSGESHPAAASIEKQTPN